MKAPLADRSSFFQAANCSTLNYGPALTLKLSGGVDRRGHPAIHAVLHDQAGRSELTRSVSVTLPKGELLDNSHIDTICTRVNFAADTCPAGSRIGTVTATTPLLDQPLSGGVYLRASSHRLPDMVLDLRGQVAHRPRCAESTASRAGCGRPSHRSPTLRSARSR